MSAKRPAITIPASFIASKPGLNRTVELMQERKTTLDQGSYITGETLEIFGGLLGPKNGPNTVTAQDTKRYLQSVSLDQPYQNVVVPLFGQIVTWTMAETNNFLTQVICPPWNTPQQHFSVNRKEFNHVQFTNIGEHGIPDEQTHFTYGWVDSVDRCALNDTIDRDLALDPNFGAQAWLDSLAQFSANANLTIQLGVIYGALHVGYTNIVENRTLGRFDHHLLQQREADEMGLFPLDTQRAFAAIRNYENQIPELDSVIGPANFMQSLRDMEGESRTVPSQRLWTNPETEKLMIDIYEGPDSVKTINLGDRKINFFELSPFAINTRHPVKYQPLVRKITMGQYHPPYPDRSPFDGEESLDPNRQDVFLYHQNKTTGVEARITLRQRLEGSNFYDKKKGGSVQPVIHQFVDYLNQSHDTSRIPWTWNPLNPNYDKESRIKNDQADYSQPEMRDVTGKQTIKEMPFRELPWGIGFNPAKSNTGRPYYVAKYIGGLMPSQVPGPWVYAAARKVGRAMERKLGVTNITEMFSMIDSFVETLNNVEWTDAYVEAIINKNLPKMLTIDAKGEWKLTPQITSAKKLEKLPGANPVDEFKTNPQGGLDLPDRGGASSNPIPAGMGNAVGILTLARHADIPESLWKDIGVQAKQVVRVFEELLGVADETIGKTKTTEANLTRPWSSQLKLAVFMDNYIQPAGPLMLGVPGNVTSYKKKAPVSTIKPPVLVVGFSDLLEKTLSNTKVYPITNRERAIASVNRKAGIVLEKMVYNEKPSYIDSLIHLVIDISGYTLSSEPNPTRIVDASAIVMAVEKKKKESDEKAIEYINAVNTVSKTGLPKLVEEGNYPAITVETTSVRMSNLRSYEKQSRISGTVDGERKEKTEDDEKLARLQLQGGDYEGNYSGVPLRYLRTPLTDSPKLREYLREKTVSYVLPADRDYYYELPMDIVKVSSMSEDESSDIMKKSMPFKRFVDFHAFEAQSSLNGDASQKKNIDSDLGNSMNDEDDIFASLRKRSNASSSTSFVSQLLSGGIGGMGLGKDFGRNDDIMKKAYQRSSYDPSGGMQVEELRDELFEGAWEYHEEYMEEHIASNGHKYIYQMILEAPNTLEIHLKLATIGTGIVDVMMIRPFIQAYVYALLLCKAGASTWIYAYGHSTVQVTKELRGLFHLGCGFEHGMIRTNPDNAAVMPASLFHSFIGGMKVDFMTNPDNWSLPNPNKESIIAFLIPKSENTFTSPTHLRNEETYIKPGEDYALWERKCSAFGELYDFIYRKHNPRKADITEANRVTFNSSNNISHTLHLGPTAYIDPNTGKKVDRQGYGPAGDRRMNQPGSQLVWNGQSFRFPEYSQYLLTTQAF